MTSGKPWLQAILPGDIALSQCDSFNGKMVLKRLFLSNTGEDSAHLFRSQRDKASSCSPRGQSFELIQQLYWEDGLERAISQ